jgi:hypothetical protein
MTDQPEETQAQENVSIQDSEEQDRYHNPETVIRIALTAKTLSWVVLILAIALPGSIIIIDLMQGAGRQLVAFLPVLLAMFVVFAIGASISVGLQALSESLYILLDIEDNTCRTADK